MIERIKAILASLRKAEYQNPESIHKLVFFNSQAYSALHEFVKELPWHEDKYFLSDQGGLLGRLNRIKDTLLSLQNASDEKKRGGFDQVKQKLTHELVFLLSRVSAPPVRRRVLSQG